MRSSYLTIFPNVQIVYHPITDLVTNKSEGQKQKENFNQNSPILDCDLI